MYLLILCAYDTGRDASGRSPSCEGSTRRELQREIEGIHRTFSDLRSGTIAVARADSARSKAPSSS